MREMRVSLPKVGLIAVTRAMLGAGIGLLVSNRLDARQRKAVGLTLLAVGALSTIPIAISMVMRRRNRNGVSPDAAAVSEQEMAC